MLPFFENKQEQIFCRYTEKMSFPAHLHHHVELLYVTQGETEILIGTQWHTASQGSLAIIFPGKVHAYRTPADCRTIMLIAPLSFSGPLKGVYRDNQPVCPILCAEAVPQVLVENITELTHTQEDAVAQALVHLILARVLYGLVLQPRTAYDRDTLLYSAISQISHTYRENIQLSTVAAQLGVSECHLSRILSNGTGVRFREYVNSLRVADAQRLLSASELSILEVALECGFQNLRTFNRAFLAYAQCTPKEYRKRFSMAAPLHNARIAEDGSPKGQ
ncbi:MAG: AraC family transcriptional regulator [Gemmiger sp.]|nr:AraC family transcriptional regulator [Gemmiger sp.]